MRMITNVLFLSTICLGLVGCATSRITNLTPTRIERNSAGLYPIEAAWETREHALRADSLKPKVLVGHESFEMRRVPVVRDRWETMVPVPAGENSVRYRFKFDYECNAMTGTRPDSKLSPEYKLEIVDKK
jgi:hypothetical protein